MKAIVSLSISEFKLFWRDFQMVFWTIAFPMVLVILFGEIYRAAAGIEGAITYLTHFMPGLLALSSACVPLFSIAVSVAQYRDLGIYRRLRVTPISPLDLAVSHIVPALLLTLLAVALVLTISAVVYDCKPQGFLPLVFLAVTVSYMAFSALAFALAALVRTGRAANSATVALLMPMMLLSGVLFPHSALSDSLQTVSAVLPLTHGVELIRNAWHGTAMFSDLNAVYLAGWTALGLIVSKLWFRWE